MFHPTMATQLSRLLSKVFNGLLSKRFIISPRLQPSRAYTYDHDEKDDEKTFYQREFVDMKTEDFRELYENPQSFGDFNDSQSIKDHIDTVLNEYEDLKYNSFGRVPSSISLKDMRRLIEEGNTISSRDRLFNFFFKREMAKASASVKRQKEKEEIHEKRTKKFESLAERMGKVYRTGLVTDEGKLMYGLWHNSIVCRIPEIKMKQCGSEANLIYAALYGKKIVFDFQYERYMNTQTMRSSVEQVQDSYGLNRFQNRDPFDLWFCNFDKNSLIGKYLIEKSLPNLYTRSFITVKPDCFTNYFDKSRLVYLSPNSKDRLQDLNNDDVYVIGVYNDKGKSQPLSLRRAENLGIRCKSLPLDLHVAWQGGSKSLCINHVFGSLLEVYNNGGNWRQAFLNSLPSRKIKTIEQVREEEERRLMRYKRKKSSFNIRQDTDLL